MTAAQEPRAGEVLTADSVNLLRAGDVLRVAACTPGYNIGNHVIVAATEPFLTLERDDWPDYNPLRFAFVSRPSESSASVGDAVEQACGLTAKDALAQPAEALAILRGLNAARVLVVWADGSWREMGVLDMAVARDEEGTIVAEIPMSELGRTQAPAREGEGWRPIDTAPKDGTAIDAWRTEGGRETVSWGYPPHECGEMGSYCDSDWHSIRAPGWVCTTFGEFLGRNHNPFTHWMPLPAGPSALSRQHQEGEGHE